MENNEYCLTCTSTWDACKIIDECPVLSDYETRIDYPYLNKEVARLIIKVDDIRKFCDDIGEKIIIAKCYHDEAMYSLEIYNDYRE